MRRLIGAVALAATFLGGATFGPSLLTPATAEAQAGVEYVRLAAYENESVIIELEYDSSTLRATGVVCTNNSPYAVRAELFRASDHLIYSQRFPPGVSRINIPTTGPSRIQLSPDARHIVAGYDFASTWPVE